MTKPIRAIGFDLGETLLYYRDTPPNWASLYPEALRTMAAACRVSPTPERIAAAIQILSQHNTRLVPRTHEIPASEILSAIIKTWGLNTEDNLPLAIETFFTYFQQHLCAYPETAAVLTTLRAAGLPIGILTDVPYGMPRQFIQRDLAAAGLSNLFDILLTSVEVGLRKPEPIGYQQLAKHLGITPDEMLYIGNEPKDIIGAKRAGAKAAFLDRNRTGENHSQDFTLITLDALQNLPCLQGL